MKDMKKFYRIAIPIWLCVVTYIEHIGSITLGEFGIIISIMMVVHAIINKGK